MATWKECFLGDLITFQRGHDLPKSNMKEGKFPVVGSNGIIGYHNEYTTNSPSITVGRSGNVGKPFIYYGKSWSHNTTLYVKQFHNSDPVFIYYFLQTLSLENFAGGSAVPTLNRNHIHSLLVCVPEDVEEQRKIGACLKIFDDKIKINSEINNHLEQQVQALYCDIFDVHVHPEWPECHISDLGTVVGGSTPSKAKPEYYAEDGIAWITPKDLSVNKSKFISRGEHDISELGLQNSSASVMPPGTVLFSSRAPIGYIAIADGNVTTNQGFKSVVPYPEIGTAFVYYYLKNNLEIIEGMASGSTFKEVSGSIMKSVPAFIPDSNALARFNDFCAPVFSEQRHLEQQNIKLSALRDTLLPRLMSGELDVSDLDI